MFISLSFELLGKNLGGVLAAGGNPFKSLQKIRQRRYGPSRPG
jgi:hypothetical protein